MRQSKSCHLLHNSVRTTCTTSPEEIEVMESAGYSRPTYNKLVHSATTRSTVVGVIHKLTVDEFVDHTNTPTTCCGEIKTRVPGLSCGFVCVILCLSVLAELRLVTDR